MTTKQKNEEYQATLTAQMEEVKGLLIKANERNEDQARTITQLNQKVRQTEQRYNDDIAWENLNPKKDYNYFGSFKIDGKEYGICLSDTWKNSDRLIKSKEGKKGQRISVFPFTNKQGADVPSDNAESGRYDDVVVNKDHSLDDGDKPTEERGE